jgi:predicted ATPase/DNA-binding winged helix-turn-helix (wHTH) protein
MTKGFVFGEFALDTEKRLLTKNGAPLPLNPKALELLAVLIENRGKTLTKNELLDAVWPDQFVEENNLTVHIAALRKALGEKKGENRFILTVPGSGYRFVAGTEPVAPAALALNRIEAHGKTVLPEISGLFGRRKELAALRDFLKNDAVRLLTLTGAGGTGKTALARAAHLLNEDFSGRVFFAELAAARDAGDVTAAIAQALNVTEEGGRSLLDAVVNFLSNERALLILDNFEQVMPAAPVVKTLLAGTSLLKILITSRTALQLDAEREMLVGPLEIPLDETVFAPEDLTAFPSISLFVARAQKVRPAFVLNEKNARAVASICRRLDGLPLAIELAAARVLLLSPEEIFTRLENSLNLLTRGAPDLPERQKTMRSAIEWSYQLLDEEEKSLFRRLAVFSGGFTVEAAETVAGNDGGDAAALPEIKLPVLDLVSSLFEKNLLAAKETNDGGARLRMLEVVREFAFEKLRAHGEEEVLGRAHALYFLDLAEKAEPHLMHETSAEWLERLETEHDNLRAALNRSLENDPPKAARLAAALRYFWANRGHLTDGRRWLEAVLEKDLDQTSVIYLKLLNGLGQFARYKSDFETARKLYEQALIKARTSGQTEQTAIALHGLAAIATVNADFASAQKYNEEELEIYRELGDETGMAFALASLGDLALARGEPAEARPLIEESLKISGKLGNKQVICINLLNLGMAAFQRQRLDDAADHFTQSLAIARELGNKTVISCLFDGFAAIAASGGETETAIKLAGAAENLRETIGYGQEPAERIFRQTYIDNIRAAIGEKSFLKLYGEGRLLTLDAALALAHDSMAAAADQSTEIIIAKRSITRITIEENTGDLIETQISEGEEM